MPKISIIIPVYNVELYLRECLESIVNQTEKDIEIIIVNDCSPDDSEKIILEYKEKDPRIIYIKHQENKKQGGARNTGLALATGEYVWFVDSDDWISRDACELLYNISISSNLDLLGFDYLDTEGNSNIIDYKTCNQIFDGKTFLSKRKKNVNNITGVVFCYLFKLKLIKDLKFIENFVGEDTSWTWLAIYQSQKFKKIIFAPYFYRLRKNSTMDSHKEDRYPVFAGSILGLKNVLEYCIAHKITSGILIKMFASSYFGLYFKYFTYKINIEQKQTIKKMLKSLEKTITKLQKIDIFIRIKILFYLNLNLIFRFLSK